MLRGPHLYERADAAKFTGVSVQSLSQFLTPSTMSAKANRRELVARTKHDLKELEAMGELRIIIPPKRALAGTVTLHGTNNDARWDAPATRPKLAYPYLPDE